MKDSEGNIQKMPRVTVIKERCKGCGLCAEACPKGSLSLGKKYNASGYAYAAYDKNAGCTGCAFCYEICPDMALKVFKEVRKNG